MRKKVTIQDSPKHELLRAYEHDLGVQNPIGEADLHGFCIRNCEGTEQLRRRLKKLGILVMLAAVALTGCGKKESGVPRALEQESGTTLATLGDEPIYLEEALFYTRMLQEQWEYAYYESFGETMWQQEADDSGQTLEELLKSSVLDTLTELHLLCIHASEYGVSLTDEEQEEIACRAQNFMEHNTKAVLEAAGVDRESVERYLVRNELAGKVAEAIRATYEPEISEEEAQVGRLTYALFSNTGLYDVEGNYMPFTEEELTEIQKNAEDFAALTSELGDISAAGEQFPHTVIDVYFNGETDGGAHPDVARAARELPVGGVSAVITTDEGWYVVQHVSNLDEDATADNLEEMRESAKQKYLQNLEDKWAKDTTLILDEKVWETVQIDGLIAESGGDGTHE